MDLNQFRNEGLVTIDQLQLTPNLQRLQKQCGCSYFTSMVKNYRRGERQTIVSVDKVCFAHSDSNPYN